MRYCYISGMGILSQCSAVSAFSPVGIHPTCRNIPKRVLQNSMATPDDSITDSDTTYIPRRDFLWGSGLAASALSSGSARRSNAMTVGKNTNTASPPQRTTTTLQPPDKPLADLPMIRLRLPTGGLGREYVAVKLRINNQGPFDFMLDTGLTLEFITPHLQQSLGIETSIPSKIQGLAAGGTTVSNAVTRIQGASFVYDGDPQREQTRELPLPPLTAIITDFPQEHIDPAHDPVEGMLGMELLSQFDVDFDFPAGRLRLWKPGTAALSVSNMITIPAVVINETGLIGIRITTASRRNQDSQPILGFLDCGSSFSVLNWSGAQILGLPDKNDPSYKRGRSLVAVGIDGRPLQLPVRSHQLDFVGDARYDSMGRPIGFTPPPSQWKPWNPIEVAVGDLPAFSTILGDGITPFRGPACLLGLDILAQRRIILEASTSSGRQRRVLVSPV